MPLHHPEYGRDDEPDLHLNPLYSRPGSTDAVPRLRLPDGQMDPETVFQLIRDELLLDGQPKLNLATFVTTWMEPQATILMADSADRNLVDKDEYPQTAELERRCVHMIADLWNASTAARDGGAGSGPIGCSTTTP